MPQWFWNVIRDDRERSPAWVGSRRWGRDLSLVWKAIGKNKRPNPELLTSPVDGRRVPVLRVPESLRSRIRRRFRVFGDPASFPTWQSAAAGRCGRVRADAPEALKRTALVFACFGRWGGVYAKFFAEIVERGEGAGSPLLFPETVYNAPASHIAARLGTRVRSAHLGWRRGGRVVRRPDRAVN